MVYLHYNLKKRLGKIMEYKLIKEADFIVSNWSGGKTRQIGIFPEDSKYIDRKFVWRLSSATVETDESKFSKLPDYDRVLMVLEGDVVLAHQDERVARLKELEQDRFDGAFKTTSFGKITDYNLMVEKGNEGYLDVIKVGETSQGIDVEKKSDFELGTVGLYCKEGFFTATINGQTVMVNSGDQLIINFGQEEKVSLSVMGEGTIVRSTIFYNYRPEAKGPTVIPQEKATFDDFKTCIYLANIQFRGANKIFRNLKNQWFDEELKKKIRCIEKPCIPFFIAIIGVMIIASLCVKADMATAQWLGLIVAWLVVDSLLVSPLIYFFVMPKPVRKHIKDVNNLTPYEQKLYDIEMNTNERVETILKKYKSTGRYEYEDKGEGINRN